MSSSLRRVVRIRVLSSVVVKCRIVGIRVLSLALLCWGWVSVPRARHREWLPLPWSECDDRAGRKTFNVPNSRDWVLSLAQRGYGFGPLAGTLQHLAIRLFVGHSLIARLNGPLQPKSGSDPLLPCAREVHTHTDTQTHRHTDTQTHRHTDTHTHTHTHTCWCFGVQGFLTLNPKPKTGVAGACSRSGHCWLQAVATGRCFL